MRTDLIGSPGSAAGQAGSLQFRPACRIRKTDEYSSVFVFRRSFKGRYFTLHLRPVEGGPRLGLVIAKKLARQAVLRNLIKRLARDVFRHQRASLRSQDMVVRLSASPLGVSRAALRADLEHLVRSQRR